MTIKQQELRYMETISALFSTILRYLNLWDFSPQNENSVILSFKSCMTFLLIKMFWRSLGAEQQQFSFNCIGFVSIEVIKYRRFSVTNTSKSYSVWA